MNLQVNEENFKALIEVVSEYYNIDEKIIEKDYWVTYCLSRLLSFNRKDMIIFRGGTSLTKCYKDLKRFSEDIDLSVNKTNELSTSQLKKLITDVEKHICSEFQECNSSLNIKQGAYRNVEYTYPTIFKGSELREMNSNLKIETVTFLTPNPFEKRFVNSIIYNYLKEKKLEEFIKAYNLEPFEINVLSIYRTLMDKMVSLVRMSYNTGSKELLSKTRHLYDLHLTYDEVKDFYLNKEHLSEIVSLVRVDEENSRFKDEYPYLEKWSNAPIFEIIYEKQIEDSYKFNFGKEFVYGNLPAYSKVVDTLKKIQSHLKDIGE